MRKYVKNSQIKSKERVAIHGEVFTGEREVNALIALVGPYIEEVITTFLENKTQNWIRFKVA